jgi:hypothetical protein
MQLGMRKSIGMCVSWLALRKSPRSCSLVIESGITPVRLQCLHPKTCRFGRRSPMAVGMGPVNRFTHSQIAVRPRGSPQKLAGMSCGVNEFSRMPIPFRCVSSGTSGKMPLRHDQPLNCQARNAHRGSLDVPEVVAREAQLRDVARLVAVDAVPGAERALQPVGAVRPVRAARALVEPLERGALRVRRQSGG